MAEDADDELAPPDVSKSPMRFSTVQKRALKSFFAS
jgi:hypothetical protein